MKIYTRVVLDWDGNVLEEDSYDYTGPLSYAGGGGGNTTTVQKADPWEGQQPYLLDVLAKAQNLYNTEQPTFYPGTTTARFTPLEQEAQRQLVGTAQGGMQDIANQTSAAQQFLLGDVLRADSNPYMTQAVQGAIDPIYDRLLRQTIPGIQSGAVQAGQLGSSRQGVAEGLAITDANRLALNTSAQMLNDMYGQNLDALTKGLALTPQSMQVQTMPASTLAAVGEQQRLLNQADIDEAVQRHTFQQSIPWDTLAAYQGLIQGNFGGTGTSTASGGGMSTGQKIAGAAGTGLSTYAAMSMIPALGPAAPFVAGGMALLSLF